MFRNNFIIIIVCVWVCACASKFAKRRTRERQKKTLYSQAAIDNLNSNVRLEKRIESGPESDIAR